MLQNMIFNLKMPTSGDMNLNTTCILLLKVPRLDLAGLDNEDSPIIRLFGI